MTTRRPAAPLTVSMAAALMLVLAACGSGPADSGAADSGAPASVPPAASEPGATEPASPAAATVAPASPAAVGDAGSFTVNGTTYAVTRLNRCIPFSDAPGNVDLQALAGGAQLNLNQLGDTVEVSVQGPAIEQAFGSISFGRDAVVSDSVLASDRWTGSANVGDSLGSETTVDLTWDVMVPAEIRDCSL